MKIAIIGKGNVGTALANGLESAGHEIKFGHKDPSEPVVDAAKWGEVVILAVPFSAVKDVAKQIAPTVDGKVVVDVTNVLGSNWELAIGFTTSGAEELQKLLPKAHVVKAFNTVFAGNMNTGKLSTGQLSAFIAGDNADAKEIVMKLAKDIGFEPVDTGPLNSARYLEPMAVLLIGLGYGQKMGSYIGFKLLKE